MKNGNHNYIKRIVLHPMHLLGVLLVASILFISVGFSALSTILSVNGNASFIPIGMIRVMSMSQGSLVNATEVNSSIDYDSIKNTIDLNSANGYATYNVVIKNLGQIDYVLDSIEEVIYSNDQIEYLLDGFQIGNVIHAGEEVTFQVKFKYKDNLDEELESRLNSELKFEFVEYESPDTTVFRHLGACIFNGTSNITGNDCQEYWNKSYIDTGISLYNTENWQKDYEIGFTVEEWIPANNVNQAVFVNTKYENESLKWPGLVVRRIGTGNASTIEVTQTINNGAKVTKTITVTVPFSVKILRIDGIVYYVIDNSELIKLQDMSDFRQQFDITTWFGAAPDQSGNEMRNLTATLSNMYIKLGKHEAKTYTVTFDPGDGTVSEPTRSVTEYTAIGTLPVPVPSAPAEFAGWYTDTTYQTRVESTTIVNSNMTLHAKWSSTSAAKVGDTYYASIGEAIAAIPDDGNEYTINLLRDSSTKLTFPEGKNIVLDCGNYTITNNAQTFILENYGNLKIVNGIFRTTSTGAAAINNESTGTMTITGSRIIATGKKQAVYNNGGTMIINGNTYLSATSNDRGTLQNLNNGTMTVTSATVESTNFAALVNQAGTLVIGTDDSSVDSTTPLFKGKTYGINSSVDYSLYDGIAKGITNAVNDSNKIINIDSNSTITTSTEEISGTTYETLYLEPTNQ